MFRSSLIWTLRVTFSFSKSKASMLHFETKHSRLQLMEIFEATNTSIRELRASDSKFWWPIFRRRTIVFIEENDGFHKSYFYCLYSDTCASKPMSYSSTFDQINELSFETWSRIFIYYIKCSMRSHKKFFLCSRKLEIYNVIIFEFLINLDIKFTVSSTAFICDPAERTSLQC